MSLRSIVTATAVFVLASLSAADSTGAAKELPSSAPTLGGSTVQGCFSNVGTLHLNTTYMFNAQSWCAPHCFNASYPVAASYSKACYCGELYPNSAYLVDDSRCSEPCPGFGDQACGGLGTWTVYNTGIVVSVGESPKGASASSSSVSSSAASKPTADPTVDPDQITTVTASSEPQPDNNNDSNNNKKDRVNIVGIAVGVVVGVVAAVSIGAAVFYFLRRKKNSEIEEEHRRNAAVNAFISGGKPPGSSGGMSMADSRMDPVLNRRGSDGSIADNQDYSRRILRVTNA